MYPHISCSSQEILLLSHQKMKDYLHLGNFVMMIMILSFIIFKYLLKYINKIILLGTLNHIDGLWDIKLHQAMMKVLLPTLPNWYHLHYNQNQPDKDRIRPIHSCRNIFSIITSLEQASSKVNLLSLRIENLTFNDLVKTTIVS